MTQLIIFSFSPFQIVSEVIVDVLDINDTPPKFEKDSYSEFVSENVPVGTVIAELKATDADTPANTDLTYSFAKQSGKGWNSPLHLLQDSFLIETFFSTFHD